MKRALYAGSFDPFTNGHLSVVKFAAELFDEVLICIANNINKSRQLGAYTMAQTIEEVLRDEGLTNCRVVICDTLIAQYCKDHDIGYLVRGIRNTVDYMSEEDIARVTQAINPELKTVYFRGCNNDFLASSMVKELLKYGAKIDAYVPRAVASVLYAKERINKGDA